MLFDAHTKGFAALGGVALRGIYDNMKTAVDKVKKGKGRIVNKRFAVMCAHYLFDAEFCNVASGWEKGVVEKNVQDSRRRIWIEAGKRKWASLGELNAWLGERCRELWVQIRHPEHKQFSVAEMLELERDHLMPMPASFDGYVEDNARVSSTCLVSVARNRYSVPCELVGQMVSTRLYPTRVAVVAGDAVVAEHERLSDKGKVRYDWHESFAVTCLLALAGAASDAVRVPRLTVYAPRFLPTLGRPHAVALHLPRCGQLGRGLAPRKSRPCWAHKKKARLVAGFLPADAAIGLVGALLRKLPTQTKAGQGKADQSQRAGLRHVVTDLAQVTDDRIEEGAGNSQRRSERLPIRVGAGQRIRQGHLKAR
jgi:hypothetical protein